VPAEHALLDCAYCPSYGSTPCEWDRFAKELDETSGHGEFILSASSSSSSSAHVVIVNDGSPSSVLYWYRDGDLHGNTVILVDLVYKEDLSAVHHSQETKARILGTDAHRGRSSGAESTQAQGTSQVGRVLKKEVCVCGFMYENKIHFQHGHVHYVFRPSI
jgi:hypothetical protein